MAGAFRRLGSGYAGGLGVEAAGDGTRGPEAGLGGGSLPFVGGPCFGTAGGVAFWGRVVALGLGRAGVGGGQRPLAIGGRQRVVLMR